MNQVLKKQTIIRFVLFSLVLLVFSLLISKWYDAHGEDFAEYWQAGHMILTGQNIYDSNQWLAVRQAEGTAFHSEPIFQYPLPFPILISPIALLSIQAAYTLWIFFTLIAVLASIVILLGIYPLRTGYLELLAIIGVFLFRPMFSIVHSGQIVAFFLLFLCIAIRLFMDEHWFLGGFFLSLLSLKPSIALPVLLLVGIWLLFVKQWRGLLGMILGGFVLLLIGILVNFRWVIDYLHIGGNFLRKYYGMNPTLWGAVDQIFKIDRLSLAIGTGCAIAVVAMEIYLFRERKSNTDVFPIFASILPAALLITPYSWNYDQILLTIPILFLLITIATKYRIGRAALFMLGMDTLAVGLVIIAYTVGHDVWSFLNSFVVWIFSLYFVTTGNRAQNRESATPAISSFSSSDKSKEWHND